MLALAVLMLAGLPPQRSVALDRSSSAARDEMVGNRAALVVRYEDGSVDTACVSFSEPVIYGDQVLQLAGIDAGIAADGRVCNVQGVGCNTNDCWCQCTDFGSCTYWAYYHLVNGAWQYSNMGATIHQVADGAVEGWSWGKGDFVSAIEPPVYTFEQICAAPAQVMNGSGAALESLPRIVSSAPGPEYVAFSMTLLCLAVIAIWVMRRRTRPVRVNSGTSGRRTGDSESY